MACKARALMEFPIAALLVCAPVSATFAAAEDNAIQLLENEKADIARLRNAGVAGDTLAKQGALQYAPTLAVPPSGFAGNPVLGAVWDVLGEFAGNEAATRLYSWIVDRSQDVRPISGALQQYIDVINISAWSRQQLNPEASGSESDWDALAETAKRDEDYRAMRALYSSPDAIRCTRPELSCNVVGLEAGNPITECAGGPAVKDADGFYGWRYTVVSVCTWRNGQWDVSIREFHPANGPTRAPLRSFRGAPVYRGKTYMSFCEPCPAAK